MKTICLFVRIIALTFSFNVFAIGYPTQPITDIESELPLVTELALNQEVLQKPFFTTHIDNTFSSAKPAADISSELLTEVSVYLIIIAVYSLYWLLFCSKKLNH
jgi:hypothetical protein